MYIGHIPGIGSDALTGVGVSFPIIMIISAFASLVGMGARPVLPSVWAKATGPAPSRLSAIIMAQEKIDRVWKAFRLLLISAMGFSMLIWLGVMLGPKLFASMFTNDQTLIDYAAWAIRIYFAMGLVLGAQLACQQTFIALGNAKISVFLAIFRKIILLIPLIFIFPLLMEDKVFAVFLAEPVADTIAAATTVTMFAISFRKLLKKYEPADLAAGAKE